MGKEKKVINIFKDAIYSTAKKRLILLAYVLLMSLKCQLMLKS